MTGIMWEIKAFGDLSVDELYDCLKLRVDVFVVEQECPYPELDDKDRHPDTLHLTGRAADGRLTAYLRILSPGVSFDQASIGRVAVAASSRGEGLSREMMNRAVSRVQDQWPGSGIRIGAQEYLEKFYVSLGFKTVTHPYLEDGIPHLDMEMNP